MIHESSTVTDHGCSSWGRGLNESTNGLTRQDFSKESSFDNITGEDVDQVMNELKCYPQKTFNFRAPHEAFFDKIHQKFA